MGEDYIDQLMASGQDLTMDDIVRMATDQKPKELSPLAKQLLANWQGLGENVGIGSAGTERAEIGGRPLAQVAEDFAQRLQSQGVTDLSKAQFTPGQQAAWTAEGHGNVSLVATKDGRLVPVWGSSSDAGKARQVALALGSALVAPGLAGALGGGLAGSAGAGALLGAGRAAVTGGDILKGALTGGLTGGAGYGVSTFVDPFAADIGKSVGEVAGKTVGEAAKGAISGAARSAVGAGLTGGNIGDALLSGAIGGGANAAIGDTLSGLPKEIRGPVTAAVSAGLLGKDPTQAAIMSYAGSLLKGVKVPGFGKGLTGDIDLSGNDATEGFFAPGGEGYVEPDAGSLPDWALDPYKDETKPGDYYAGLDKIIDEWDEADIIPDTYDTAPRTTMPPQEMARFLEANIDDPGTIDTLMQDYFPELYSQRIDVTGTLPKKDVIIPDWDIMEEPDRTPGSPTDTTPQPPMPDDDRTVATTPAVTAPAPKPATPGKAPTPSPAPKAESKDPNMAWLAALFGMLGQQQPTQAPSPYQTARINAESPYGLMYGLRDLT